MYSLFTEEISEQTRRDSEQESNDELRQINFDNGSIELQCVDDESNNSSNNISNNLINKYIRTYIFKMQIL